MIDYLKSTEEDKLKIKEELKKNPFFISQLSNYNYDLYEFVNKYKDIKIKEMHENMDSEYQQQVLNQSVFKGLCIFFYFLFYVYNLIFDSLNLI